jgi:hypothetical protein
MKPTNGPEYKTSELTPHFNWTQVGGTVFCDVFFTLGASGPTVSLEPEAIATCNSTLMSATGGAYTGNAVYTPGATYTIAVVRSIDGSSTVATKVVP